MKELSPANREDFPAILIVNQDATIRKALRVVFDSAGYFVWEVGTLRDAVEIAEHIQFDVLFVDKVRLNTCERDALDVLQQVLPELKVAMPKKLHRRAISRAADLLEDLLIRGNRRLCPCYSEPFSLCTLCAALAQQEERSRD